VKSTFLSVQRRLQDFCNEFLAFVLRLRQGKDPGPAQKLRYELARLLRTVDAGARGAGVAPADLELAKFALVATVDEFIANAGWPISEGWVNEPLARELFEETNAGERFFANLQSLLETAEDARLAVLEVYYTCLAVGFQGRLGEDNAARMLENCSRKLIAAYEPQGPRPLSPQPVAPDAAPGRLAPRRPVWIAPALLVVLAVAAYTVFWWLTAGAARAAAGALE
jgi:type VI secretion system protein ImpK